MYCWKCGAQNPDGAATCDRCGTALARPQGAPPVHVPSHLVWAILCTIFCCMPFGVVAIVYAAISMSKAGAGDYAGALSASQTARIWCWVSFVLGLLQALLWVGWLFLWLPWMLVLAAVGALH